MVTPCVCAVRDRGKIDGGDESAPTVHLVERGWWRVRDGERPDDPVRTGQATNRCRKLGQPEELSPRGEEDV